MDQSSTLGSKDHSPLSPDHYKSGSPENGNIEAIEVIEAFKLGFNLGNVVKYILRADKKGDRLENLKKARQYLNREIEGKWYE